MGRGGATKAAILMLLALAAVGCSSGKGPPGPPAVPVRVAQVEARDVPVTLEAIGTVEAFNSVTMFPRITGQILRRHFTQGQEVSAGGLLFSIDPAPFREKLKAAEGALARSQAALVFLQAESDRNAGLLSDRAVSKSTAENSANLVLVEKEKIRSGRADVEQARLDLSYCEVRSPIGGRTGEYLANEGAFVEAYKTKLVVVNQVRPIFATFSIPERDLPPLKKAQADHALQVTAKVAGGEEGGVVGRLVFIDNQVDLGTGMIRLKAEFPNLDSSLWPGQFVDCSIALSTRKGALVVPSEAVVATPKGPKLFVVGPDQAVELKEVAVGEEFGGRTVLLEGASLGQTVVTDGQNKLKPGSKVKVTP